MNKKRVILFSVICLLALAAAAVALFVPTVQVIGKDHNQVEVYNKVVSVLQYIKDGPFLTTVAEDVYFSAEGPIWMATSGILMNILIAVGGVVLALACMLEVVLCKVTSVAAKDNLLAKKLALYMGGATMLLSAFAAVSYYVTTKMANGYAEFNFAAGPFILFGLGLAIFVLAFFTGKREKNQNESKYKNIVGFSLAGITSAIVALLLLIPQFSKFFINPERVSVFSIATYATQLMEEDWLVHMGGDIPFGIAQYVTIAVWVACAFVFVYSIIGIVRTLLGKKTNWLSARVKRWSMALLLVHTLLYMLVFCELTAFASSLYLPTEKIFFLEKIAFAFMFVPFLPYIFSTEISYNKVPKEVKESVMPEQQAEQPKELEQAPENDAPVEAVQTEEQAPQEEQN